METNTVLNITDLTKVYGNHRAVDRVTFSLHKGEILGLLGPNGAGKTTTINMILGILEPTEGKIEMLGREFTNHQTEIKKKMNFAAVYAHMPANLTVKQNLFVFGLLYGVKNLKKRITHLLEEFNLEKLADTKSGLLSSGEMSRLTLAKALINEPCLLLLDEPTASLDPNVSRLIREKIKAYSERTGAAILWTSHNMSEIEAVCDQVLFLSHRIR